MNSHHVWVLSDRLFNPSPDWINFSCVERRRGQTFKQWDAIGSSSCFTIEFALRSSWPAGWDFCSHAVMTEQMVRLPVWAPLSASDAFQSSWPAPGSSASLEAVRCSVSTSEVSPCLQHSRSEHMIQRGCFPQMRLLLVGKADYFCSVCIPSPIILRIASCMGQIGCSSLAYGGHSAS